MVRSGSRHSGSTSQETLQDSWSTTRRPAPLFTHRWGISLAVERSATVLGIARNFALPGYLLSCRRPLCVPYQVVGDDNEGAGEGNGRQRENDVCRLGHFNPKGQGELSILSQDHPRVIAV